MLGMPLYLSTSSGFFMQVLLEPRIQVFFFFLSCMCTQETSLAFTLPHKPGSFEQMLLQLLESFPLCAEIGNEPDFSILPRTIAGTHIQWP